MMNVGIIGASGYTGAELARILCNHPDVKITVATSRQHEGQPLSEIFPSLKNRLDIICENLSPEQLKERADFFFTAVPHKTAMNIVPELLFAGKKVIDLSADFRIRNQRTYEKWYQPHTSAQLLKDAVYGLPEIYSESIKTARLVANPGCYPTSIILGLAPLLEAGTIQPQTIIADSKSGASGAGRAAQVGSLFCEIHDGFKPYKVGRSHRHIPEIEQELSSLAQEKITITFTPHLLPLSRGILSTVYGSLNPGFSQTAITEIYRKKYSSQPFVRLLDEDTFPATQHVRGSNFCDIGFKIDTVTNRIIVITAIDNVVKGAAGQAVQNMNLMSGFKETTGLEIIPLFP